ncbi:MAG: SGNH/GDSL hydrolase family protein [Cytophagales bacterium]
MMIGVTVSFMLLSCSVNTEPLQDISGSTKGIASPERLVRCGAKRVDDGAIRILFVGNSLTYSNNLPKLLEVVGNAHGKNLITEALALPNYALEDHWNDNKMQAMICEGNFDFVVVQQGPSSQADGREMLLDFGQRIKKLCESRGTELAFFMVWPAKANYHTFDGVITNYTDAASETGSLLCAVGTEFKMHGDVGSYWFYSADNFHPSVEGSQRAAEIIYSTLIK